jgi:hypothetical protein
MKSKTVLIISFITFLIFFPTISQAGIFYDNFDDGNADGWSFPYLSNRSQGEGLWTVKNGSLIQSTPYDHNAGLVDNLLASDQIIETHMSTVGYAGVVLWYQGDNYLAVILNAADNIWIIETVDANINIKRYTDYWIGGYPDYWYDLKVDADSETGNVEVWLNDVSLFTHIATTTCRNGMSGVWSGNAVGFFDDFQLISDDIDFAPVPEPTTMLLLGPGLICLAGFRKRLFKKM